MTTPKEEIGVAEAARRLNVQITHAYNLLWANRLRGRKVNRRWLIDAASVIERKKTLCDAFATSRRDSGE